MIEGDDSHAADTMHNCFDEAAKARAQDSHRPARMTGGLVKFATLAKLSQEKGGFMSPGTHARLKVMFSQIARSLQFLLQVREATAGRKKTLNDLAEAEKELEKQVSQGTAAEGNQIVIARGGREQAGTAVENAARTYSALKAERGTYPLFRYRMIYDALQAGRKHFDIFASQDPAFGGKVVRDRLETIKGKGKSCSINSSRRASGSSCKRPAADMQGDVPSMKKRSRSNLVPILHEGEKGKGYE